MKSNRFGRLLLTGISFCFVVTQFTNAYAAEAPRSGIRQVTVFSDRARVMREMEHSLKKGENSVTFSGLPGWIDSESVRVAVLPVGKASVIDVEVERKFLAKPQDSSLRDAQLEVQELQDKIQDLSDELAVVAASMNQLKQMRIFSREKLPEGANRGSLDIEAYGKVISYIDTSYSAALKRQREIERGMRELNPELIARTKRLAEYKNKASLQQSSVQIVVRADAPMDATLQLSYMVPGTTWEPVHELRAAGRSPDKISFATHAVLTQTTGEDWTGAEIRFSTQSPVESSRIPEVQGLFLESSGRPVAAQGGSSFGKAQQRYSSQISVWNSVNNDEAFQDDFYGNYQEQSKRMTRNVIAFREIEKRGTSAQFKGLNTPVIRADGTRVRIPIGVLEIPAVTRIVAAPRVSLNAAVTADLEHNGEEPILPGKVAIYRDGAFMGQTEIDFVSPGERFSVYLGVADQIKLSRTLNRKTSNVSRGRRTRLQAEFALKVQNLSRNPVTVELGDRIPVSQSKDVRVYGVKIVPKQEPDDKGAVRWSFDIPAEESRSATIAYTLEYPPALLEQSMGVFDAQGSAIEEDVMNLEMQLK